MTPFPQGNGCCRQIKCLVATTVGLGLIGLSSDDLHAAPLLLAPPPPVEMQGFPKLQTHRICPELQNSLQAQLGTASSAWSVSVVDSHGQLLADINGQVARVPASNQKLITTAFALDRLGPDFRLQTKLLRRPDGVLEITGEGDPDLGITQIQRFAMVALGQGGSRIQQPGEIVQLVIREEPRHHWWPSDWHPTDRVYAYGAPITRLALTSNALEMAVSNPAARLQSLLDKEVTRQGGQANVLLLNQNQNNFLPEQNVVLHQENSAPMHALLSLANTESHNFTAEVLLRQAANSWDMRKASLAAMRWMQAQNLPIKGLRISDGSGLSRNNRVSTRTLSSLLMRMSHHPLAAYYQASMAIAGQRGTLRKYFFESSLRGRFWGKSGTLSGVRSISGILETKAGPRYMSLISNGASDPNTTIGELLKTTQQLSPCPSFGLNVQQHVERG
ncbi:MAG: D-alanyl-D-alanine carboxypeptidase/D-alanyl-D-alanine-endopeptidase [Prochlorococcus sp.]